LGTVSALSRSAGSLGVSYVGERVRMSARAELWGQGGLHEAMAAEARRQALLTLAFQARLSEQWRASGRLHAADSTLKERRAGRFVEGHVGLAWFAGAWTVAGRYAVHYERPPEGRPSTRPRLLQTISLLPAWDLTERFTLGGGLHLGVADRKSTRLNSSHVKISYAVFCLKKKKERARRASAGERRQPPPRHPGPRRRRAPPPPETRGPAHARRGRRRRAQPDAPRRARSTN